MAGTGNSQVINGQQYAMYSPEWYAARDSDQIGRGAVAGKAAGAGTAGFLSQLPPSLLALADGSSTSSMSASGSGRGAAPTVTMPAVDGAGGTGAGGSSAPASTPHIAPVDFTAANTAAFATAKDQAAQTARASLNSLAGELSARGMGGAGYEAGEIGKRVVTAADSIGAAGRAQAQHEADLGAQAASENYQGDIAQRGQDTSMAEADANRRASLASTAFSGGITQRGQDLASQEAADSLAFNEQSRKSDALFKLLGVATNGITRGAAY